MFKDKFIDYIQFEKRYSSNTIIAYNKDLEQFLHFVNEKYNIGEIAGIDHHIVRSWIVELMENNTSARSVNRKLTTLKSYFKFLLKEGLITDNPMYKVITPKTSKRLPYFVEQDKMQSLFVESYFNDDFQGTRDRLILDILYSTGIRLSELINLTYQDINIERKTMKVLGKRKKERIVPFGDNLKNLLICYIKQKQKSFDNPEAYSYLLVTNSGKKIYSRLVYRIVNKYLSMVSTLEKRSPHVLRHTFATHMLNNGADLNAIKELLGHSSLAATQVYTHNTIEQLKSIYNKAHPRA